MKKTVSVLILAAIVINLLCFNVFAEAGNIKITVDIPKDTRGYADITKSVTININTNVGMDTFIKIVDESSRIIYLETLLAIDNKGEYSTSIPLAQLSTGNYKVYVTDSSNKYADSGDDFKVSFYVASSSSSDGGGGNPPPRTNFNSTEQQIGVNIENATTDPQAESKINQLSTNVTEEQKKDPTILDKVALVSEKLASNVNAKTVYTSANTVNVTDTTVTKNDVEKLNKSINKISSAVSKNKFSLQRDLFKEVILKANFNKSQKATIIIDSKVLETLKDVDTLTIADNAFRVSYKVKDLASQLGDKENIKIEIKKIATSTTQKTSYQVTINKEKLENNTKVTVNFNTNRINSVKVSFPGLSTDATYNAVVDESGKPVGGKYNPITNSVEAKLNASGIYSIIDNKKDFDDIKSKGNEMQDAIKILASKGVINGTSTTEFSPDGSITRAEVAALILRVLAKLDPNADGGFADVKSSDWYFGTAGSSKKYGLINGYPDGTFQGGVVIPKEQIVAIAARVLRNEMKYKTPENKDEYLTYVDKDSLEWSANDVALATMANLVSKSTDNKFEPNSTITRGDAALILKKMFDKIW